MEYFVWDIDPLLFSLGFVKVRWYGLMFALAFLTSFYMMQWIYVRENKNPEELDTLLWYLAIATVGGARLGHCLFYDPAYYLSNPLKILAVWEGGLASHGANIGIIIGLFLYNLKTKDGFLWLCDRVAVSCTMGAGLIRTGNFFNSEILGEVTDAPWAIIFARIDHLPRHPVQLYEALCYFLIFLMLLWVYKKTAFQGIYGLVFGLFTSGVFLARFFLEFLKTRQAMYESDLLLSTGQVLSIPFFFVGVFFVVRSIYQYGKQKNA